MKVFSAFRALRSNTILVAGALLVTALMLGILYAWSPRATLRITTGISGGIADRFVWTFIRTTVAEHPRLRFEPITVNDLTASARVLEERKVDIALVRSDATPAGIGQSLAILRRDAVAIVLPPSSTINNVTQLAGKKIAIAADRAQKENSRAFDLILDSFNVPLDSVERVFLPASEIGAAIRNEKVAAAVAIGPIGPGAVVDVVASIAKAMKGAPDILALGEREAIAKKFPGFEPISIPEGAFKTFPPTPSEAVKTLAVTYRFAVPTNMLDIVAGALGRSIFTAKAKLMAASPVAKDIEAPDPTEKNSVLPVHPGVAAYLASGDQSFVDQIKKYLYVLGIPLSLAGSAAALVSGFLQRRNMKEDQQRIFRLLVIANDAAKSDRSRFDALDREFHALVAICVAKLVKGGGTIDKASVSLAIDHARRAIEARRAALAREPPGERVDDGPAI